MSTKITTPVLIDLPGETLSSENTSGVVLPKGTTSERPGLAELDFLVVAGGGGASVNRGTGGGGAGGLRTSWTGGSGGGSSSESKFIFDTTGGTSYTLTVGDGGAAAASNSAAGGNGADSVFSNITSIGGGGGPSGNTAGVGGNDGGSGSGGGSVSTTKYVPGSGEPNQGYAGGVYYASGPNDEAGGGGGGAGAVGSAGYDSGGNSWGGAGGVGLAVNILNTTNAGTASVGQVDSGSTYFAGGGGGGFMDFGQTIPSNRGGDGGTGGGGNGGGGPSSITFAAAEGTPNTGGGAGGAGANVTTGSKAGGSGVVILRYSSDFTLGKTGTLVEASGSPFTETTTKTDDTTISVFISGSGTVNFTGGATLTTGEFRYNTTDKLVEFYNGSTWKQIADEYISGQPSTCVCNYPTTATALYQLEDNTNDTCGNYNATNTTDITYNSSGKFGKSAVFNGTSSYFKLPFSTLGDNPFTISMWLKFDDLASERYIFSKYPGSGGYGFMCSSPPGVSTITFNAYNTGSAANLAVTTTSMSTGVWYNYVLTFDFSSSIKAYLNGSQEATVSPSGTFFQNSDTVYIGRYWNGPTYFDGEMDQIRLFPSALSSDQVTDLYNEVACT